MFSDENRQKRMAWFLFLLCWVIYFISYLGRRNLSAAMSSMITLGTLTTVQAGAINTAFFISYALGQLVNGILADRLSPKRMVLFGLCMAGVSNALMAIAPNAWLMLILWALNGYAMAMLWPPILRIFTMFFASDRCMRSSVHIATAPVSGAIASYLVYALLLARFDWKAPFFFAAIALSLSALLWYCGFARIERSLCPLGIAQEHSSPQSGRFGFLSIMGLLIIPLMIPVLIQGMLRDGVSTWVPTYLTETFLLSPDFAVGISVFLPVMNLAAPYLAHFAYQKICRNELLATALFFALTTLLSLAFLLWGGANVWLGILLFSAITTCMEAANTLLVTILPLRFVRVGKPSSMSGFMNFLTYAGSALSTFGVGALVAHFGWEIALPMWCFLAAAGFCSCLVMQKLTARIGSQ